MGEAFDFHALSKAWGRLQVAAGCGEWPLYSFRHFWASTMLASGESLAYVSRQLGHAKQSLTLDHYSRFIPDTKRQRGADRLAAELLHGADSATSRRYQNATNPVTNTPKSA